MNIDIAMVRKLRALTGVGITDAKKALEDNKGDFDKALEMMRVKGLAKADKRGDREAQAGLVYSYIHDNRIGVLLEVNCETDFVARNQDFRELVHNLALHIAASSPLYVDEGSIPENVLAKEKDIVAKSLSEQLKGKSPAQMETITAGKMAKFVDSICLLNQPYVKDLDQPIADYVKSCIAKLGENIVVRRFARIELGQYD